MDVETIMSTMDAIVSCHGDGQWVPADYAAGAVHNPGIQQNRAEIKRFVAEAVLPLDRRAIVEVGMGTYSNTHSLWRELFQKVITVDIDPALITKHQPRFADERSVFVNGNSHRLATLHEVKRLCPQASAIFIDGDHSYDAVFRDWTLYRHIVSQGGIVAFHDCMSWGVKPFLSRLEKGDINGIVYHVKRIVCSDCLGIAYYVHGKDEDDQRPAFSLICPSRDRPWMLDRMCRSIANTTKNLDDIEVIVAIDRDDSATMKWSKAHDFSFVKVHEFDRQDNLNDGYFNFLAYRVARGKFIQALNDDTEFLTSHWDVFGSEAMEAYVSSFPDRIGYGRCDDGLGTGYACFPVLTREAVNAAGWFFHPEFRTWSADIHLHGMYAGADRCISLPYHIAHYREEDQRHRNRFASLQTSNMGSIPGCVWNLKRYINDGVPMWK